MYCVLTVKKLGHILASRGGGKVSKVLIKITEKVAESQNLIFDDSLLRTSADQWWECIRFAEGIYRTVVGAAHWLAGHDLHNFRRGLHYRRTLTQDLPLECRDDLRPN